MRFQSMRDVFQAALDVQDACNLSGVGHLLVDVTAFLRDQPECTGTAFVNEHPAVQLITDKLADLARVRSMDAFSKAYDAAKAALGE